MGGEERFRFLLPTYCLGTSGAIFLYDITNKASLDSCPSWLSIVREKNGNIPIILAGNKIDLEDKRQVPTEMGIEVAKKIGLAGFVEVSAKEGINIEKTFSTLTDLMLKYVDHPEFITTQLVQEETTIPEVGNKIEENKLILHEKKPKKILKKFKKIKVHKKKSKKN